MMWFHHTEGATLSEGRQKPPEGLPFPARWTSSQRCNDEPHRRCRCFLPANGEWQSSRVKISAGWYYIAASFANIAALIGWARRKP